MFLDLALDPLAARSALLSIALVATLASGSGRPIAGPAEGDFAASGANVLAAPSADLRRSRLAGPFAARVLRVIDGDTFEARTRVWFGHDIVVLVRLRGIDAPERAARCGAESRLAEAAREHLELLLSSGEVTLSEVALDKYAGRVVADVTVTDAAAGADDVARLMLASGRARPYGGARRGSWCAAASEAQRPGQSGGRNSSP